jgi:uncharacterized membrane protein HdeD (DUF308 family)
MSEQTLSNKWVNLFVNGLIALAFGTVFIFIPETVYVTIILVLGGFITIMGFGFIYFANKKGSAPGTQARMLWSTQGLVNIGIGIFMMLEPELFYRFVMTFLGIWLIIAGSLQLFDSHMMRNIMSHYRVLMLMGFINIALGLVIILWPEFPIKVFGYIAYFIALVMFTYAIVFYKYRNKDPKGAFAEEAEVIEIDESDDSPIA